MPDVQSGLVFSEALEVELLDEIRQRQLPQFLTMIGELPEFVGVHFERACHLDMQMRQVPAASRTSIHGLARFGMNARLLLTTRRSQLRTSIAPQAWGLSGHSEGTPSGSRGAAEGFAAGRARRLGHGLGQVQRVVANQANPTATESRFARRRLHRLDERMPIELDQTLAFAAADQYIEALHRHVEFQRLDPFDIDPQGVVVAQIIELGAMLTFNRLDPQRLALPVALRPLAFCVASAARRLRAVQYSSS